MNRKKKISAAQASVCTYSRVSTESHSLKASEEIGEYFQKKSATF